MLDSSAATTIEKTYSCNRAEKLSSRFLGHSISGDVHTTYSIMATIFNTIEFLHGSAMLRAKNNRLVFLWEKMLSLMKNIFIVLAMQHGIHAKPPLC